MPFTYDAIADRVKDDVGSFQFVNRILNNLDYLKQQSEVLLSEDATELDDDVVKPKHLVADNEPQKGTIPISDSASQGSFHHTLPWLDSFLRFTLED